MERRIVVLTAILAVLLVVGGVAGVLLLQQSVNNDDRDGGKDTTTVTTPSTNDTNKNGTTPSSNNGTDKTTSNPTVPTTIAPTPNPSKIEPVVSTALTNMLPLSPSYGAHPSPVYGDRTLGQISTWVSKQADAAHIGILVYFVGLSNNEVYVNATTSNGQLQWINLYNDGSNGCYGMLMDDPSAINNGMGWTWMYTGSSSTEYHNISITATIYKLGPFQMRTYAYDQDTGKLVSDTQTYNMTVTGTGGKYYPNVQMFNSTMEGGTYLFTPGEKYYFNFTDTCNNARYEGTVRSVFTCPYVANMWMVNSDGSLTLVQKDANGYYSWTWDHEAGTTIHTTHLLVQLGVVGGGSYSYNSGDYYLVDGQTNLVMSRVNGESHPGIQVYCNRSRPNLSHFFLRPKLKF
jgi:hypothetical protein